MLSQTSLCQQSCKSPGYESLGALDEGAFGFGKTSASRSFVKSSIFIRQPFCCRILCASLGHVQGLENWAAESQNNGYLMEAQYVLGIGLDGLDRVYAFWEEPALGYLG